MTDLAVISVALAAVCFCVMHIVSRVIDYRKDIDRASEREKIRKELENEILNGGNIARISQLRKRMRELS